MSTHINIMNCKDVRVSAFSPSNHMALTLEADRTSVNLFGMPAEIAWSMFDLMRDGDTAFHFYGRSIHALAKDPEAAASLIREARAATLPVQNAEAA